MAKARKVLKFPRHFLNEAEVINDFAQLVDASEKSPDFKRIAKEVIAEMSFYRARQNPVEPKPPSKAAKSPKRSELPLLPSKGAPRASKNSAVD
ncbi:MAG: hypothetical protein E5X76_17895 [Mesorhizobium sp.]|nr:MAG: hypothetical protein E5X76_17895 [Mesorhizobium sp.]